MRYLKTYNLFESDSWAGSLYAYNKSIVYNTTEEKPRETFSFTCGDCGVEFSAFTPESICKNCGSENTGPIPYGE